MNKASLLKIGGLALIGAATAAYQDIHAWLGESPQGKFQWGIFLGRVLTGALAGGLAGVGVNVATS